MHKIPDRERGAALLTVLLLVAVMAVVAAVALERLTIATRLAANGIARDQASADADSAALLAMARIERVMQSAAPPASWAGRRFTAPLNGADVHIMLRDGGSCFNLNSVVDTEKEEQMAPRAEGVFQFRLLMQLVGVDPAAANAISVATADWIDSNNEPLPEGAEDETYQGAATPYRTANRYMRDPSELRAVRGVTADIYALLRPWICALPSAELSPININALEPDEAPLLAMLFGGKLSTAAARQFLAQRPAAGWPSAGAMLSQLAQAGVSAAGPLDQQIVTAPRWLTADIAVKQGDAEIRRQMLVDARNGKARLAMTRSIAEDER